MTQTATRLRRTGGAGVAVGALVASALMFAPSAQAAAQVNVTNAEVLPTETTANYTSWHQGYANNPGGAKVTTKGLELSGGPSQVIKGYADNDTTIGNNKNFDLAAKITGADFTATTGVATLQVPLRSTAIAGNQFATIRSLADEGSRIKLTDEWVSSKAIGSTIAANTPTPLRDIVTALGTSYKVIGFGVQADNNAVISDITWDGVTYTFKEPSAAPAPKLSSVVDIYRVNPKSGKITTKNTVSFYASVTIDGKAAPAGTVVNGYAKGKKVATSKVNSKGKVKLVLKVKLPKGSSTLKAELPSSGTVKGSTDSVKVKVIKKK
ncbi:hypothetical protein [Aeromicrobium wangtongii]|uniref:Uncharacterized protein n=1 Tax=Aeromicrobium wangtongii TaxID=2969247 RepID=A0ABY5M788_9ACTN|nr:hypothetical protein [Aeromicrobium wangtongii]MCD9199682.1 hypothetical protein [Aeromicrobium wangtongii]UUP14033.1 hypothetical protein NQV15_01605 [Aeromicrobium wangtongii]